MNAEVKQKWTAALRGGEYKQARKQLRSDDGSGYCCLGVLCELYRLETGKGNWGLNFSSQMSFDDEISQETGIPTLTVRNWAGLTDANPDVVLSLFDINIGTYDSLAGGNDAGLSFLDIADVIEAQL